MNLRWKPLISFFATLLLGFALGLTSLHWISGPPFPPHHFRGPEHRGERFIKRFAKQLDLSDQQKSQVSEIFEKHRGEMEQLRSVMFPKFEALRKKMHAEIKEVLNPEQLPKFDKINKKISARRRKLFGKRGWHRGPRHGFGEGPPPGPPPREGSPYQEPK